MGRWGGEEFLCVCYGNSFEQIKELAENVRKKIESVNFDSIGNLTCSIGITELKSDDTLKILFDRVDCAMYEAKLNGRNCVVSK